MRLETSTVESPTIRSPPFSLLPITPLSDFDIEKSLLSENMGDDSSGTRNGNSQPSDEEAEFFDLQPPPSSAKNVKIEDIMARLTSAEHLNFILADHTLFSKFSAFLNRFHAQMIPTLIRYLEMRKAVKAIEYANAVARKIRWPSHTDYCKFSRVQAGTVDVRFEDYASRELLLLCSEALPAFVTHTLIDVVMDCVAKDITGQAIPVARDLIGNLGEVFCLTDPSVHDNPIIYASEEFHRTTQYGTTYAIDRNCRFLQGPATDKNGTLRIARAISLRRECNELLLNYRRDGTPFINLLMCAPLYDDKGAVRYFIGAQIDVTGLIEEGMGIESFRALLHHDKMEAEKTAPLTEQQFQYNESYHSKQARETLERLTELSMMFSQDESDVVNRNSRNSDDSTDVSSTKSGVPTSIKNRSQAKRIIGGEGSLGDGLNLSQLNLNGVNVSGCNLPGVYKHYILVRPHPSLQICFVSPSLRLPGILRTHLFSKLGGPSQTISALEEAFRDGASVTAKVLWLPKNSGVDHGRTPAEAKPRWMRCTPLLGSDDRVGVWMIILVPVDGENTHRRREHVSTIIDEVEVDRKRYVASSVRSASRAGSMRRKVSMDRDAGVYGLPLTLPRTGRQRGRGRADNPNLYSEYLRSSSPSSRNGRIG